MRRHLTPSECQTALNRGKQIEQFLGGFLAGQYPAIRYAVIRRKDEKIVVNIYEEFEPDHADFYDVGEFQSVEPDTDPEDLCFDTLEEAVSFLQSAHEVSADRFVNQGLVGEEYKDYKLAKIPPP